MKCDVESSGCLTPEATGSRLVRLTREIETTIRLSTPCGYEGPRRDDDLYDLRRVDDRNAEDVEVCVQLLVDAGADLEARDRLDLHAAARRGLVVRGPGDGGNVETDVAVIAPRRQSGQS